MDPTATQSNSLLKIVVLVFIQTYKAIEVISNMESPLTQFLKNPIDFEASFQLRNLSMQFNENDKLNYLNEDIHIELRFKSKYIVIEQTKQEIHDKKQSKISILRLPNKVVDVDNNDLTDKRNNVVSDNEVKGYLNPGDLLYTGTVHKFKYSNPCIYWDTYHEVINKYKTNKPLQNYVLIVNFDVKVTVPDDLNLL